MHKIIRILLPALLCLLAASCSQPAAEVDGWQRSKADRLNKLAFQRRYYNAEGSERYARQALQFINDSLPNYDNGRLRAWNNIATSFCFRAMHDSAIAYVDSVLAYNGRCSNREVEQTLAQLVKAKLLQRNCDIAGSYQILYNIENSGLLEGNEGGMLYNLARSEFYITTTTLNYHYRSKSQYQQAELLTEMEQRRDKLRCDYAEDMSFNYALAYGYYSLCSDTAMQGRYLGKALHYCAENLHLLGDSNRFNTYHLGDTYQLLGFMLWSRHMKASSWLDNAVALDSICRYVYNTFGFDIASEADTTFAFLREATSLFFLHDDPYQRLGAIVSTGRYCMVRGDTATARNYFYEALIDSTMLGIAPKFEAMLYEGFLTAGCAENLNEVAQWTRHEIELLNYIKQNERADFMLQLELSKTRRDSRLFMIFSVVLAVLSLGLVVTLVLLRRRTKALQRETTKLQQAKQQDIERIANVETCLSVLRHDITPFISYPQNDKLPDELKHDVTNQLIRTFENIKNWTNLSIPSGLQFRATIVHLQELFDRVSASINNFRGDALSIHFESTSLSAHGDNQLLEIMLRNLVNNAIQYTAQGSISVSARPWADDDHFVQVSIADTGCGMSADELENLFRTDKKLKTAPAADHTTDNGLNIQYGTGFGLILCRYIIKKHDDNTRRGCRIWAESEPGKGSTFHFLVERGNATQNA